MFDLLVSPFFDSQGGQIKVRFGGTLRVRPTDKRSDVSRAHATGVHCDNLLITLAEWAAMPGNQHRIERTVPIARNIESQRLVFRLERFLRKTVSLVAAGLGCLYRGNGSGILHDAFVVEMCIPFALKHSL